MTIQKIDKTVAGIAIMYLQKKYMTHEKIYVNLIPQQQWRSRFRNSSEVGTVKIIILG